MTIRRMKTYTGGQGYVYQYYFVGKRASIVHPSETPATEYIFDATSDRKTTFAVSVFLTEDAIKGWSAAHGRTLTEAEQYGAVKMRLFQAFDEIENMMVDGRQLFVNAETLEQVLAVLGVD
jgi:pyruvate/2-oxoacid:ferredoxin oxidoreductase alpha subunit